MMVSLPRACTLSAALLLVSPACLALDGSHLKQRADAVLMLMSYTVVPDVTASRPQYRAPAPMRKISCRLPSSAAGRPE